MPIVPLRPLKRLSQEQFHQLDYRVMGLVFEIHNDLGHLCDEVVYKREMAFRLLDSGIEVAREFPIQLIHENYERTFFVDLLVDNGAVYEAKTVSALVPAHRTQALNYLFLTDTQHGRLLNFRTSRVEHEFVSTKLDSCRRRQIDVISDQWCSLNSAGARFKELATALVLDWGAFLPIESYRDAIIHFFGGPAVVCREENLVFRGRQLGTHEVHLIAPDTIIAVTAVKNQDIRARAPPETHPTDAVAIHSMVELPFADS